MQAKEGVEGGELVPGVGRNGVQVGGREAGGVARGVDEARHVLEGPSRRQAGRVDRLARLELGGERRHGGWSESARARVWLSGCELCVVVGECVHCSASERVT